MLPGKSHWDNPLESPHAQGHPISHICAWKLGLTLQAPCLIYFPRPDSPVLPAPRFSGLLHGSPKTTLSAASAGN